MTNINNKFIFRYKPQDSIEDMFCKFNEAIEKGIKHIQPANVSLISDLRVINRILSKNRLEVFAAIQTNYPENIYQLAQQLNRDYSNV